MLNLQDLATTTNPSHLSFARSDHSQMSSIRFDRIIGNLGESLRDGSREDDEDEEDAQQIDENAATMKSSQKDEEMQVESAASLKMENAAWTSPFVEATT